jgi:hypothetical protein
MGKTILRQLSVNLVNGRNNLMIWKYFSSVCPHMFLSAKHRELAGVVSSQNRQLSDRRLSAVFLSTLNPFLQPLQ